MSPPYGPRRAPQAFEKEVKEEKNMIKWCLQVAEFQTGMGTDCLFESAQTSGAWHEKSMGRFIEKHQPYRKCCWQLWSPKQHVVWEEAAFHDRMCDDCGSSAKIVLQWQHQHLRLEGSSWGWCGHSELTFTLQTGANYIFRFLCTTWSTTTLVSCGGSS